MENKPLYTVYMAKYARLLQARGFQIIKIIPNIKDQRYCVYQFEDTPEFQRALSEIISNK